MSQGWSQDCAVSTATGVSLGGQSPSIGSRSTAAVVALVPGRLKAMR